MWRGGATRSADKRDALSSLALLPKHLTPPRVVATFGEAGKRYCLVAQQPTFTRLSWLLPYDRSMWLR